MDLETRIDEITKRKAEICKYINQQNIDFKKKWLETYKRMVVAKQEFESANEILSKQKKMAYNATLVQLYNIYKEMPKATLEQLKQEFAQLQDEETRILGQWAESMYEQLKE